uniref:Basement membrane-specific heparan sulfate proteoglycan core protein n=1 Tax=Anabas testudineus TaxID=64144 RepID=A0A7N6BAH8_ANATE
VRDISTYSCFLLIVSLCDFFPGLFPAVLNLASMADITANATCGSMGPEMFCKLVEHVPGQPVKHPQCQTCDQRSTKPLERHPIEYAIDGTNQWWQSPSIQNGMEYHYVTITLDLKQIFQIAYVIVKAANSPRPGNWILERSIDGVTFEPWQYYAITDTECLTRFNLNPRTGPPSYTRDDEVICTSFYSKIHPLENGEIHTSLINGRPSADDPSPTLLNFTSARYIRLVFQRIRTLNADLMTLTVHDPKEIDPIVTRRYYYSIKDISVGGMCICYGHAKACPLNTATKVKYLTCECEHNTCGESCDRCCPGYHQQPWMAGTFLTRHVCEKCNCHGKADECYFNQTVADLSLSLDTHYKYRGGGVCIGCRENTAGINCQSCIAGYYRPTEFSADDEYPCIPCDCDPHGSVSQSCVADSSQATSTQPVGSCRCKEGFGGLRCDRCAVGYKDYPSCQRCNCSVEGSTNVDPCITPCLCKENVEGENCDRCKLGFYNLQADSRRGCEKCSCMGVASQCSASTWTYQNVSKLYWVKNQKLKSDLSIHVRHTDVMNSLGSAYYWNAPGLYLGNKGGGIKIIDRRFGRPVYPSSPSTNHIVLLPEYFQVSDTAQPISRREFLSVLANVTRVMVRASYSTEYTAVYRLHSFSMQVANPAARGEKTASAVEMCSCPPGYAGTSCEACIPGFRRVNGSLYNGVCEACRCHGHATQCDKDTGRCLDCSHHTTGHYCDTCLPGYYDNATRGSPADCKPCACPFNLPSNNFSPTCHLSEDGELLCNQCQLGYTGPRCNRCSNGYYGKPDVPGGSCRPCDCHGNLDLSIPNSCDPITGRCLRCRQGYSGVACDSCAEGYYGDAITAKNCQPCQCHTNGSVSEVCSKETGQCLCRENVIGRQCDECMTHGINTGGVCVPCHCNSFGSKSFDCDEMGQCRCQPGVIGPKCDRCSRGFFNFQEGGCTPCLCSHVGDNCDANTGQCICPPNTIGERCDRCAPNHWGHDIVTGCKECGCSVIGSVTQQCNVNTGCCRCRDSFRGEKCDECQIGYRDFPQCTQCECNISGSDSQTCDLERGVCACADRTGKCSCKENVEGDNCDQCKPETFGLSVRNPLGCSKCYCYGLTHSCTEAQGLIRMWLTLKPEQTVLTVVDKSNTVETRTGVSFQHPEILAHAELVTAAVSEPYYWKLPEQFKGSMITAYGGQLKYAVYYEARDEIGPSSYEPQVIIKGGAKHNIVMTRDIAGLHIGQLTRHEIDMTEHEWKYADGRSMTREDFMDVLFYVDYILIKASHGNLMRHSRYARTHKLECAAGFYRLRSGSLASVPVSSAVPTAAGMGSCVQCQCNRHSSTCDAETSICQNCQDNTEGDRCERCAPGFYGVVRGYPDDCKPCACPLPNPENNFSPTCVAEGLDDYRCTACPEGYEGKYCDRCATGYHGNPRMPGGHCEECKCSLWGALPGPCDPVTGQCSCRVGALGKSCDQCMDRHVSCDDECSGLLISDMDRLYRIITEVTLTTPLPPPYKVLYRFENMTEELKVKKKSQCATYTAAKLAATKAVAADANATAIDVLERLGDLNLLLHGLKRNYIWITTELCLFLPSVHAAGAKVKDLEDEADRLLEKLQPIKKLQDNLRRNISQIKELINQARKQANSIKVSVSSGGDCLRSYRPEIRKGRYNTIILHVKTTTPDNLLFYLGSVDFLALEMRKGKVSFLWDVGSGVGRVEYPHHTIHDGNWHRIEASRNGLNGTISVYPLEGSMAGMMPTATSSTSPTAYTILDVDQNAYLFVGGIFGTVKKADVVRTTTFTGCMGETFLDGKPIGLWNYRERQGDCKGCRSDGEGTVQLDGEGYAAVGRPTRWNPNISTVTFKFRTFSSDALLMYLKDFMSLELSEGKVKVNFDLGSGVGSAISANRHNDGRWKSLTMSRNKKQATVTVVDIDSSAEEKMVATSQGSATGLNLKENQKIYFGGLPTIGNYRYTHTNLYTVSFSKPGYMELGGLSLGVDTEISLSFSTLADTGTILLAVGGASPNRQQVRFNLIVHMHSLPFSTYCKETIVLTVCCIFILWHMRKGHGCDLSSESFLTSFISCVHSLPFSPLTVCVGPSEVTSEDFQLDMAAPTAHHMVGRCFVATETGTYFDGTGFLKAVSPYRVGLDVLITLEFRTSRTNGVLLTISNQVSDGLGLEIVEGKLLFHVDNGAGRITAEHMPDGEGFCDGQWHSITAKKVRHKVELVVDGKQSQAESPNVRSNTCDTNDPIYIGGYPDGVRQVALSTNASFRGCMRNLKITKAAKTMDVHFNKALEIKGVQPLSCPAVAA